MRLVEIDLNYCLGPTVIPVLTIASVRIESGIDPRLSYLVRIGDLVGLYDCFLNFFAENSCLTSSRGFISSEARSLGFLT